MHVEMLAASVKTAQTTVAANDTPELKIEAVQQMLKRMPISNRAKLRMRIEESHLQLEMEDLPGVAVSGGKQGLPRYQIVLGMG
jgi:hypothetical protein